MENIDPRTLKYVRKAVGSIQILGDEQKIKEVVAILKQELQKHEDKVWIDFNMDEDEDDNLILYDLTESTE